MEQMTDHITHLLLDTETLGKYENAVVLTLSCVAFILEDLASFKQLIQTGFHVKFNAAEQISKYHRTTDPDTIDWWKTKTTPEARRNAVVPHSLDVEMIDGLTQFSKWVGTTKYDKTKSYIWSRGPQYDFPKVEHMFDQAGIGLPYNNWKVRDVRTYIDILAGVDNARYDLKDGEPANLIKHHSLHDAAIDALRMNEIYLVCAG